MLMARDRAVDRWLREQVAPAYDALKTDGGGAITPQRVRARLAAEHQRTRAKKEVKTCAQVRPFAATPAGD